jgi:hypothetical protein
MSLKKRLALDHATDEALEAYAVGRMKRGLTILETHLLICELCRERLDEAERIASPARILTTEPARFTGDQGKTKAATDIRRYRSGARPG